MLDGFGDACPHAFGFVRDQGGQGLQRILPQLALRALGQTRRQCGKLAAQQRPNPLVAIGRQNRVDLIRHRRIKR